MNFLELRLLFELLCDQLEDETNSSPLVFQAGYGIEFPVGVVMVFVFEEMVVVCRFLTESPLSSVEELPSFSSKPLSADECLDMRENLRSWKGGFQALFQ